MRHISMRDIWNPLSLKCVGGGTLTMQFNRELQSSRRSKILPRYRYGITQYCTNLTQLQKRGIIIQLLQYITQNTTFFMQMKRICDVYNCHKTPIYTQRTDANEVSVYRDKKNAHNDYVSTTSKPEGACEMAQVEIVGSNYKKKQNQKRTVLYVFPNRSVRRHHEHMKCDTV